MDMHFTYNEIQPDASITQLKILKETPSDVTAYFDIPQSALFRTILQDQGLLKSFLDSIPSILLNDALQAKNNRKILATTGLNEVEALQERWRSKMAQSNRSEPQSDHEGQNPFLYEDTQHKTLNHVSIQRFAPTIYPIPPTNKRPIEIAAHSILTTLEHLQREQRNVLDDPNRIALIVSEGIRSYYAVDSALKFMTGLYPSLPTMFEVPYKPGYIISHDLGLCQEHPLMSDNLAQFYEQVFGTCTKLHFRFRTILEHYEAELYRRFHNLPPGARTLEALEDSLSIWSRNLCASATFVAAIEKAEMTKDYSTLAVIRQTADSLGGVANLLKFSVPHALVPALPAPQHQNDPLNSPMPSLFGGTMHIAFRVAADCASIDEICAIESNDQCTGLIRVGQREYNLSTISADGTCPLVTRPDIPKSPATSEATASTMKDSPVPIIMSEARIAASKSPCPKDEESFSKRQASETGYEADDDKTAIAVPLAQSETLRKHPNSTGKRRILRNIVTHGNDAQSISQPTQISSNRSKKAKTKLEVPKLVLYQAADTPQGSSNNENDGTIVKSNYPNQQALLSSQMPMERNSDSVMINTFTPSNFQNNFQFSDEQCQIMPTVSAFDYNSVNNMNIQMNNQPYIPPYCPISQNLFHAATAYLGYNTDDFQQMEMQMPTTQEPENTNALVCLSDAALSFPSFDEGAVNGNTEPDSSGTLHGTADTTMFEPMSYMKEEVTMPDNTSLNGLLYSLQQDEGRDADGVTDDAGWDTV